MTENTAPIEDRAANIQQTILHIITSKQDEMFEQFDRLHRRNIHDDDVVAALRYFGEIDLLDQYAEWAEIDLREDDNTTTSPDGVTDPGDSDTNRQMTKALAGIRETGHVNIGGTTIEFGRDVLNRLHLRPEGGTWVGVVENAGPAALDGTPRVTFG